MLASFSTVAGESGAADTERDVRGFSLKFYTEEGNWDMVGNNTPVFFVRDGREFSEFIRTQKRYPKTNLRSLEAMWDFWSQVPESLHQVTILMSHRGIPTTLMHMNGYGHIHSHFEIMMGSVFGSNFISKLSRTTNFIQTRRLQISLEKQEKNTRKNYVGQLNMPSFQNIALTIDGVSDYIVERQIKHFYAAGVEKVIREHRVRTPDPNSTVIPSEVQ